MENEFIFETIQSYNDFNNNQTLHPLVGVVDLAKADPRSGFKGTFHFYTAIIKEVQCGNLIYGKHNYDYQAKTLVFFGPGQTVDGSSRKDIYQPEGKALVFHQDFISGTPLVKQIDEVGFFSYNLNEALHLSEEEQCTIHDVLEKIYLELKRPLDKHSKKLITANINLFLDYCERFYDRQFLTRQHVNSELLNRFEHLMKGYFLSEKPYTIGLPSVGYFAEELHLSANYFGDMIKKETGKTAQDMIQSKLIDIAKDKIFGSDKSVKEIAFELGFKYPQHFNRVFKQKVGITPKEFRENR